MRDSTIQKNLIAKQIDSPSENVLRTTSISYLFKYPSSIDLIDIIFPSGTEGLYVSFRCLSISNVTHYLI